MFVTPWTKIYNRFAINKVATGMFGTRTSS